MTNLDDAEQLANMMVSIGKLSGRIVRAILSDMNQPLGSAVGNAIELKEAIDTLNGKGPDDFTEHCLVIASHMLELGQKAADLDAARRLAENKIADGSALEKFRALVIAQEGDVSFVDHPEKISAAKIEKVISAESSGFIAEIHARTIGETALDLGAGRAKKTDEIDAAVGILVHKKVGDRVQRGEQVFSILANDESKVQPAEIRLQQALKISQYKVDPLPLFYGVIA
jgi:pyrimidine-nucleoside phosphorylase